MTQIYSPAQLVYLCEGYKLMDLADLTEAFNREYRLKKTESQIKSTLTNHKFTSGRTTGNQSGVPKLLTLEQRYFVEELYPIMSRAELTKALNETYKLSITDGQLISFLKNHRIKSGRTGCFEKGTTPWNTGTKGVMKPNSGNFKEGSKPANQKPIGHERVCTKDGYLLVKIDAINPNTGFRGWYRHKHVVMWETENGPVPDGFVVTFKDGDKTNMDPSNFELVDRNHLCRFNKLRVYALPKELIPTMKYVVKLKVQIHKRCAIATELHSKFGGVNL